MQRYCVLFGFALLFTGCQAEIGSLDEQQMGTGHAEVLPHSESPEIAKIEDLVFRSETPVVLDFSAIWCRPCQHLAPEMDKLAEEYDGQAIVAKIDIDQNRQVTNYFRVEGVPTVIVLNNGQILKRYVGLDPNMRSGIGRLIDGQ